jgi:hypothetical protein
VHILRVLRTNIVEWPKRIEADISASESQLHSRRMCGGRPAGRSSRWCVRWRRGHENGYRASGAVCRIPAELDVWRVGWSVEVLFHPPSIPGHRGERRQRRRMPLTESASSLDGAQRSVKVMRNWLMSRGCSLFSQQTRIFLRRAELLGSVTAHPCSPRRIARQTPLTRRQRAANIGPSFSFGTR